MYSSYHYTLPGYSPLPDHSSRHPEGFFYDLDWEDQCIVQEIERSISRSAKLSYLYSVFISPNKPFYDGEYTISSDPVYSYLYARDVRNGIFPMGEMSISLRSDLSVYYAQLIGMAFSLGEPAISGCAEASVEYAEKVLCKEFPMGEEQIFSTPWTATRYCQLVGEREEAISIISQDDQSSYTYAQCVVGGRFPEGEPAIGRNSNLSIQYARDYMKGVFIEGEESMSRDPRIAVEYAILINSAFPEGEEAISSNAQYSLLYAKVIKGRFALGELTIMKSRETKKAYVAFLQSLTK